MESVVIPVVVLGGMGLSMGVFLAYASKKFEIILDPKIEKIIKILPGINCGGCGYPGCNGYAVAVVEDGVSRKLCAPGRAKVIEAIDEIMNAKDEAVPAVAAKDGVPKEEIKKEEIKVKEIKKEEIKKEEVKKEKVSKDEAAKQELKKKDAPAKEVKPDIKVEEKEIKKEEIKVKEIKKEEIKVKEIKKEEVKVEEIKKEEVKEVKEVKKEEVKVEEIKKDINPEINLNSETKIDESSHIQ